MSTIYEGPSPLNKRIDSCLGIVLLIAAIVIMAVSLLQKEGQEKSSATDPMSQNENANNRILCIGQEVSVLPGTVSYESSKGLGSGNEWNLDATKRYRINGYSYIGKDGSIQEHDYYKPQEALGSKIAIKEPQKDEGVTLMLHLCLIEGEKARDKGWVDFKNISP